MVYPLKFRPKLNRTSRQYQSHCTTCPIIILKKKELKILKNDIFSKKKLKIKNFGGGQLVWGWGATPWPDGDGRATPWRF
jgi:hypothetical protein